MKCSIGKKLIDDLLENSAEFYNKGNSFQLLHEYFDGFPLETLHPLFSHDNLFVRRVAIWITSELGINGAALIDYAIALLNDDDNYIKHYALEAIAVCSIGANLRKYIHVLSSLECKDEVICGSAIYLISNASRLQLEAGAKYFGEKESFNKYHYEGLTKDVSRLLPSGRENARKIGLLRFSGRAFTVKIPLHRGKKVLP